MAKCSVIIAVYNSAAFIDKCLHALFQQTLDDIEYVFVDDFSNDNSVSIIEEILELYPIRKTQTKIIKLSSHEGIAKVRKIGISNSSGDYIIHCDSDDFPENNMYEELYNNAVETKADIVACNYYLHLQEEIIEINKNYGSTPMECLYMINRTENCLTGTLWDKLVKAEIIKKNSIVPFENIDYTEDLNCVLRFLYFAKTISLVKKPLYHHIKRDGSITNNIPDLDKYWATRILSLNKICNFFESRNDKRVKSLIHYWKLDLKFEIFLKSKTINYKEWFSLYKSTHKYILFLKDINFKGRLFLLGALSNYHSFLLLKKFIKK